MLKVVENCGQERDVTEKALIKELFSPATCDRSLVDTLAKKLEPKKIVQFPRKPILQELQEGANRVRNNENYPLIERTLLASILEGDHENADRLFALSTRIKTSNLTIIK